MRSKKTNAIGTQIDIKTDSLLEVIIKNGCHQNSPDQEKLVEDASIVYFLQLDWRIGTA